MGGITESDVERAMMAQMAAVKGRRVGPGIELTEEQERVLVRARDELGLLWQEIHEVWVANGWPGSAKLLSQKYRRIKSRG